MTQKPSIELNNFLQPKGQAHLITWVEASTGPQNHITWNLTCKFNGEVVGEGTAGQKTAAKEAACEQALQRLRGY